MRIDAYEFGRIVIDGAEYDRDVVIDRGKILKRKKGPSKKRKDEFGHTPLTADEDIPWKAQRLWIGTGAYGRLPVADDVVREARRRGVELTAKTTPELVTLVNEGVPEGTNLILHVTC
jgi:hypothetical protein